MRCCCGHTTRAAYDAAVIPSTAFGPGLVALVGVLTGVYHLSRRQTQRLLGEVFGISISLGSVSHLEARASAALEPCYAEAERAVQEALVKHTDATSWVRAGQLRSLWVLACASATVYAILANGRSATIRRLFGALRGILVSDRATVFGFWAMKSRQVCWAHLLRRFISFAQRDGPAGSLGRTLLQATELVFEYWHGYKQGVLTRDELAHAMRPVQRSIEEALQRAAAAGWPGMSGSCRDVLAHAEALWTFVSTEGVEPTNNHAELMLRPFVLWRKKSCGTQSERGERFAERIMTMAQTARKQGRNILGFLVETLEAALEGQPAPRLLAV